MASGTTLLVDLLSCWTKCEHNYYHYLDRDSFFDDMASGRTDFCSELLVNALLASACVSYDHVNVLLDLLAAPFILDHWLTQP